MTVSQILIVNSIFFIFTLAFWPENIFTPYSINIVSKIYKILP